MFNSSYVGQFLDKYDAVTAVVGAKCEQTLMYRVL